MTPASEATHILLLDDDTRLADMVMHYLAPHGYVFTHVETIGEAKAALSEPSTTPFAAALLDVMLPDGDGIDLLRSLRQSAPTEDLPVLMLTAKGDAVDRVVGLEVGADDYLPKPFEPRELLARLRAILRRSRMVAEPASTAQKKQQGEILRFGHLELNPHTYQATKDGQLLQMTGHQFGLLLTLARHAGRVLSREQLMRQTKGTDLDAFDRSIDVHISRIRSLIEEDPKHPKHLLTLRGVGYLFAAQSE